MHQNMQLNLQHAKEGKLYLEAGGRRVLYVFSELPPDDISALNALRTSLNKLRAGTHEFDDCIVETKKSEGFAAWGWRRAAR